MKAINILLFSLLFISSPLLAQRPAMEERPAASEPPAMNTATEPEDSARPAMSGQALDDELEEPLDAPRAVQAEPPRTKSVTTTTGTVLEVRPGETLPVNMLAFPRRGMSMDKVKNELGQPATISPTVGDPPITAWTYPDRVVYFEYSKVIHAVAAN